MQGEILAAIDGTATLKCAPPRYFLHAPALLLRSHLLSHSFIPSPSSTITSLSLVLFSSPSAPRAPPLSHACRESLVDTVRLVPHAGAAAHGESTRIGDQRAYRRKGATRK
jgi:hypothetical protein